MKTLILKIQTLRDKYIAHKDRLLVVEVINKYAPTIIEFQCLFNFIEEVIQFFELNVNNLNSSYDKIGNVGNASNILHVLVEYKRLAEKEFYNECKKQESQ